jgi:hypothetical protein
MNPELQSTHKSDGTHHGKVSHRPLNEEVLQSAVEVAKGEVLLADDALLGHKPEHLHAGGHQKHADFGLLQSLQDKATRFVLLEPLKASMLAAGAGAMLVLLLEQSLKRLIRPKH